MIKNLKIFNLKISTTILRFQKINKTKIPITKCKIFMNNLILLTKNIKIPKIMKIGEINLKSLKTSPKWILKLQPNMLVLALLLNKKIKSQFLKIE